MTNNQYTSNLTQVTVAEIIRADQNRYPASVNLGKNLSRF